MSAAAHCWAAERQETERAQRQTKKQEPEEDMELRGDKNPDVVEEGAGSKKRNLEWSSGSRRIIEDCLLLRRSKVESMSPGKLVVKAIAG